MIIIILFQIKNDNYYNWNQSNVTSNWSAFGLAGLLGILDLRLRQRLLLVLLLLLSLTKPFQLLLHDRIHLFRQRILLLVLLIILILILSLNIYADPLRPLVVNLEAHALPINACRSKDLLAVDVLLFYLSRGSEGCPLIHSSWI